MGARRGILFLTFVVTTFAGGIMVPGPYACLAAKSTPASPLAGEPPEGKQEPVNTNGSDQSPAYETVDIAEPPKPGPKPKVGYYYRYRRSFTLRYGGMYRKILPHDDKTYAVIGAQFNFMTENRSQYEIGADVVSGGNGMLHLAKKWVFDDSRLRPFTKAGLGFFIEPENNFASLMKYETILIEGALGLEYLFTDPQSVRAEIEVGFGHETLQAAFMLGYVWAW